MGKDLKKIISVQSLFRINTGIPLMKHMLKGNFI